MLSRNTGWIGPILRAAGIDRRRGKKETTSDDGGAGNSQGVAVALAAALAVPVGSIGPHVVMARAKYPRGAQSDAGQGPRVRKGQGMEDCGMTQLVDLSTPEGIYSALGRVPLFEVGQRVLYSPRQGLPYVCTIESVGVEYGHIVYTNDRNRWGYEDQFHLAPPAPPQEPTTCAQHAAAKKKRSRRTRCITSSWRRSAQSRCFTAIWIIAGQPSLRRIGKR